MKTAVLISLLLIVLCGNARAEDKRKGGETVFQFNYHSFGDYWDYGVMLNSQYGFSFEYGMVGIGIGTGWLLPDEDYISRKAIPFLPDNATNIEVDHYTFMGITMECGPGLWLRYELVKNISIGCELGVWFIWPFWGSDVKWDEPRVVARREISSSKRERVKIDPGFVGRAGIQLEIGPPDGWRFFLGAGIQSELSSTEAKFKGNVLGDFNYDSSLIRLGIIH